jgi:hypothetical protein
VKELRETLSITSHAYAFLSGAAVLGRKTAWTPILEIFEEKHDGFI